MIFLPRQTCAICALSISLAVGCSPASPEALATYDGGEVTRSRLDGLFLALPEDRRQPPAGQSLDQWLEELLFNIALEETLISRARASGVDDDQSLRLQARVQASRQVGAEYAKNRCSDFDVGDAEVEAVYEQQFAGRPRSWVLLRHIFKRVPGDASVETKSALRFEMETLLRQLEEGASFIDLAREHSDSATAAEGGLIGRVSRTAPMDKAVLDAGWSLEDGQHSAIVEVSTGLHIVFRETSGVEEPVTLDDSREKIRAMLADARRESCGRELLAGLADDLNLEINMAAVRSGSGDAVVVRFGDESFTADQLRALSWDLRSLLDMQHVPTLLREFVEALLLSDAARAESTDWEDHYRRVESAAYNKLASDGQWMRERHRHVSKMTDRELELFFESHRDRFQTDLILNVSVIVIGGSDGVSDRGVFERAWEVRDRIAAGESFADLAREVSSHSSRDSGGELGAASMPRLRVMLGSEGAQRVVVLEPGAVCDPFRVSTPPVPMWAIAMVNDREEPRQLTFAEARTTVIDVIAGEAVQELDRELREVLREEIHFRAHRRHLASYIEEIRASVE